MKPIFTAIVGALVFVSMIDIVHAGRQVDVQQIRYKDWGGKKPNVVTVVSSSAQRFAPPIFFKRFINWFDAEGKPVPELATELCRLNIDSGTSCQNLADGNSEVVKEYYLGAPKELELPERTSTDHVGMDTLQKLLPGAKKILHIRVVRQREFSRYALAVAYDDISDEDLRRVIYEEAVLCILGYREDCQRTP